MKPRSKIVALIEAKEAEKPLVRGRYKKAVLVMSRTSVLRISSDDNQQELEIERLPNGTYQLTEWTKQTGDEYTGPYTSVTHQSGLYETLNAAEADARLMLPWLRDQISN